MEINDHISARLKEKIDLTRKDQMEEGARDAPRDKDKHKQGDNTGSLISQQVAAIDKKLTRQFTN